MKIATSLLALLLTVSVAVADDEKESKGHQVEFGKGKLTMTAPASWEKKQPRVRIVAYEFAIKPEKGDERPGRLTMMQAGGSVKDNIARWKSQFKLPSGEAGEKAFDLDEKEIDGVQIHLVDIQGTFKDRPAPFLPNEVLRKDYRMLGAIIVEESIGQVFVKMYGPAKTMEANKKAFTEMVEGLKFDK